MHQSVESLTTVPMLHEAARGLAWTLSKVSRLAAAGVFFHRGGTWFVDAWRDGQSVTLRLGRVELVADLRG